MNLLTALLTLYVVWGSTYFAIQIAVHSLPPFLMAGSRFITAGSLLYVWLRCRRTPAPSAPQWKSALIVGGFLLLGANGAVVWSEQFVPSGLTALLVSSVPIWLVLFSWAAKKTARPSAWVVAGIVVGFIGVFFLVAPTGPVETRPHFYAGVIALLLASISWSIGSIYSKSADLPSSPWMSTAIQMVAGGVLLTLAGLLAGEPWKMGALTFSRAAILAWIYLVVVGSLIGYSAYVYVLKHAPIALAGTYSYVNPVVALFLGTYFGGEAFTGRTLAGAGLVVLGVGLITGSSARRS